MFRRVVVSHHQLDRRFRRDALDERLEERLRPVPTTYSVSFGSRPIMSIFRLMTMAAEIHRRRGHERARSAKPGFFRIERREDQGVGGLVLAEVLRQREQRDRARGVVVGAVEHRAVPRAHVVVVAADDDVALRRLRAVDVADDIDALLLGLRRAAAAAHVGERLLVAVAERLDARRLELLDDERARPGAARRPCRSAGPPCRRPTASEDRAGASARR